MSYTHLTFEQRYHIQADYSKGLSAEVIALLNKEVNEVLKQQDLRERLLALGIIVSGGTTEEIQARIPLEMSKWANVVKTANIKID